MRFGALIHILVMLSLQSSFASEGIISKVGHTALTTFRIAFILCTDFSFAFQKKRKK